MTPRHHAEPALGAASSRPTSFQRFRMPLSPALLNQAEALLNELLSADFAGLLSPVLTWHGETTLSEGPGHQGLAHVTRWVGQRAG